MIELESPDYAALAHANDTRAGQENSGVFFDPVTFACAALKRAAAPVEERIAIGHGEYGCG